MKSLLIAIGVTGLMIGCAAATPLPSGQDNPSHPNHPANAEVTSDLPVVDQILTGTGRESTEPADPFRPSAGGGVTAAPASSHVGHGSIPPGSAEEVTYVCPMHPEVTSSTPGKCPKCGMILVEKESR